MKFLSSLFLFVLFITIASCGKDEERECVQCTSAVTQSFELCREPDGNASINGENTGTDYDTYLEGLVTEEVTCGG